MNAPVLMWTAARIEALKGLWDEGLSASQIADRLGNDLTRSAILGKVHRLRLAHRHNDPQVWTRDVVEKLKSLWVDNPSSVAVAAEMGLTRHQVISKAFRLGLSDRSTTPRTPRRRRGDHGGGVIRTIRSKYDTATALNARRTPRHKLSTKPITLPRGPFKVEPGEVEDIAEAPIRRAKRMERWGATLLELTDETCRFPCGDPADPSFYFCGRAPQKHSAYCGFHHAQCYQPNERSRRAWR